MVGLAVLVYRGPEKADSNDAVIRIVCAQHCDL